MGWLTRDLSLLLPGLSYQLSSASTHSLPSRIDQLSDSENDYEPEEEFDSSSALETYDEPLSNHRLPKSNETTPKSPKNHQKATTIRASW